MSALKSILLVLVSSCLSTAYAFSLSPTAETRLPLTFQNHVCTYRSSKTSISVYALGSDSGVGVDVPPSDTNALASRVRRHVTGFSVTAVRTTVRTATGVSLTALYASTLAISGAWIRQIMKVILSIFPSWARYFAQPFLILYYVPLYMLRSLSSPQKYFGGNKQPDGTVSWSQSLDTSGAADSDPSPSYWQLDSKK